MAAIGQSPSPLLDQLQKEVNRVLHQTANVLKASNSESKSLPIAQLSVLRQMLPSSSDRFHYALDQLEDELQMAKLVMRRDLAVCREKAGITVPSKVETSSGDTSQVQLEDTTLEEPKIESQSEDPMVKEDVSMIDAEPEKSNQVEAAVKSDDNGKTSEDAPVTNVTELEDSHKQTTGDSGLNEEQKPPEASLQIDTDRKPDQSNTNGEQPDEDVQPDTGTFSNTNDLDSLFGGPTSAGPVDGSGLNFDDNGDFNFDSFGSNNAGDNDDNLSNLLPGLADYANTQPGGNGETDFDALFSTHMDASGGNDAAEENRDTTFDDLMNFGDFDASNFGGGNGDGGKNGTNDNGDFDFNFD